jgi:hypothetical protein
MQEDQIRMQKRGTPSGKELNIKFLKIFFNTQIIKYFGMDGLLFVLMMEISKF